MHQSQTKEPATLGRWDTKQEAYEGRTRKTIKLTRESSLEGST
jgi:hypothetical protein